MPAESFPKGWPIRCPSCECCEFHFKTDRTGQVRRYTCSKCGDRYLAAWLGKPFDSVFSEPKNTRMENWEWTLIVDEIPVVPHEVVAIEVKPPQLSFLDCLECGWHGINEDATWVDMSDFYSDSMCDGHKGSGVWNCPKCGGTCKLGAE
jgi:hypothetical protein